ncbi:MAG: sigma-70 family RNA polymerase sigma factor [Ectothiorhodospiraceae bacterium]|nr:sigma-70 family RNA polymerase sigma factor [Ectothiorhodospiraceae bacterium]
MKIYPFSAAANKHGSAARFDELVRPHLTYLYRLAFRFCGNQEDAEDLVQDLMIKLFPRCAELEDVDRLRPWLVTSLYRMFVDGTRRKKRSPMELIDDEAAFYETIANCESTPSQDLAEDQRITQLQEAFERLSDDHRVLLTLHDIEGYRLVELEKILNVPVGTLKSRIHRARAKMRKMLEPAGLSPSLKIVE